MSIGFLVEFVDCLDLLPRSRRMDSKVSVLGCAGKNLVPAAPKHPGNHQRECDHGCEQQLNSLYRIGGVVTEDAVEVFRKIPKPMHCVGSFVARSSRSISF